MNCQTTRNTTPAAATVQSMTRPQAQLYRSAWRQEPVTHRPTSGTMHSITAK